MTARGLHVGVRVSSRTSGGGQVFADNVVASLARAPGVDRVTVVLLGATGSGRPRPVPGVEVVPVARATSAVRRRLQARTVARAVSGLGLDVLLCPGTELTRVRDVPAVLWPLTVAPFEPQARAALGGSPAAQARWRVLRELVRRACARADGVVYSSHYARSVHEAASPALRDKPSAVIWPPPSLAPSAEQQEPGPDLPRPYVLFVSHLYPYKMVVELVRGFARFLAETAAPHHLVVAGAAVDPAYVARVERAIDDEQLRDRVHLLGAVSPARLGGLYTAAESFVFPSLSENAASYAVIDALVHGKPVLSSFLSSIPEICQDAVRYVDPRDPEHVAAGLAALASDPELRQELSARATARAAQLPSWDELAARLVTFLEQVTGAGSPGRDR